MVSPFECPVCMDSYNFDTEKRAMSLSCGHTVCRGCISRMPTRTCPSCRAYFSGAVPNFTLCEIMSASASSSSAQAKQAIEDQIKAISSLVANMHAEVTKCETAISSEQAKSTSTHADLKSKLAAALLPLRSLTAAAEPVSLRTSAHTVPAVSLSPGLRTSANVVQTAGAAQTASAVQSATAPPAAPAVPAGRLVSLVQASASQAAVPAGRSAAAAAARARNKRRRNNRNNNRNNTNSSNDNRQQEVIIVQSDCLDDVLQMMSRNRTPAIYDFQGQEMKYSSDGHPVINHAGVTWRNGSILQAHHNSSLVIAALCVTLEAIVVQGGLNGVYITTDGTLNMINCDVFEAVNGIFMEGEGYLMAENLRLINCNEGFLMEGDSTAHIDICEIRGSYEAAITLSENSTLVGTKVTVMGCGVDGLNLCHQAELLLIDSELLGDYRKLAVVRDESSLVLRGCQFSRYLETEVEYSASMQVEDEEV